MRNKKRNKYFNLIIPTFLIVITGIVFYLIGKNSVSYSPISTPTPDLVRDEVWVEYEQPEMGVKFKHPNWMSPYFYEIGYKTFKDYDSITLTQNRDVINNPSFNIEIAIYEGRNYLNAYQDHVRKAGIEEFYQIEKSLSEETLNGKSAWRFSYAKDSKNLIITTTYIPLGNNKYLEFTESVDGNYTYFNNISSKILSSLEFTPQ